jgi:hypothetical protein
LQFQALERFENIPEDSGNDICIRSISVSVEDLFLSKMRSTYPKIRPRCSDAIASSFRPYSLK